MNPLWLAFAGGLISFPHCLGMCGGFVLQLASPEDRGRALAAQALWQTGRISTYLFLGAAFGGAGTVARNLMASSFPGLVSYAAGGTMVLMGMTLLGLLPVRVGSGGNEGAAGFLCRHLITGPSPGAALALGIVTGFLPCPLVLAGCAASVQAGSVSGGIAVMAGLGAGTMVPLLILGGVGRLPVLRLRRWSARAGGILLVVLGLVTLLRSSTTFHRLLGCHPPLANLAVPGVPPPCCGEMSHGAR